MHAAVSGVLRFLTAGARVCVGSEEDETGRDDDDSDDAEGLLGS